MIRPAITLGLVTLLTALSACAQRQRVEPAPAEPAPLFELLEELPAEGVVMAVDVYYPEPFTHTYIHVNDDGRAEGQTIITRSATDEFGASFADTTTSGTIEYWTIDEQGRVVMTAYIDRKENALTLFNPALTLFPAELRPGSPHRSNAAMRVTDFQNRASVRETGKGARTIENVSDQRISTPLGDFIAKRVAIRFTADLRLADVDERTTYFVVPDLGVVAIQSEMRLKVFGAFGSTTKVTMVRAGEPSSER